MDYSKSNQINRAITQTLLIWFLLYFFDMLSAVFSWELSEFLLDSVGIVLYFVFSGVVAIIQGCLIGFRKKYSTIILPVFVVLINFSIIISLLNDNLDTLDARMVMHFIFGFGVCPYINLPDIVLGLSLPFSGSQWIWCLNYTIAVGLYLFVIFFIVEKMMGWLIRKGVFESPVPRMRKIKENVEVRENMRKPTVLGIKNFGAMNYSKSNQIN